MWWPTALDVIATIWLAVTLLLWYFIDYVSRGVPGEATGGLTLSSVALMALFAFPSLFWLGYSIYSGVRPEGARSALRAAAVRILRIVLILVAMFAVFRFWSSFTSPYNF